MKLVAGHTALLTGASGGLGAYIAHALADVGINLALVAYPGLRLQSLRESVEKKGIKAISFSADLRDCSQYSVIVEKVTRELGPIDLLINNAGVETTAAYHDLTERRIKEILTINLEAPMFLTRLVLPRMIERKQGHIVNISSLAGKACPAFQECYAATKAALIAFTASLRATYSGTGVSASVICPGFVEAGIYARLKARTGRSAPALLGVSQPETVARAVVRAVQRDSPEVMINPIPVRPLQATTALFPRLGQWAVARIGAHDFFRQACEAPAGTPQQEAKKLSAA